MTYMPSSSIRQSTAVRRPFSRSKAEIRQTFEESPSNSPNFGEGGHSKRIPSTAAMVFLVCATETAGVIAASSDDLSKTAFMFFLYTPVLISC